MVGATDSDRLAVRGVVKRFGTREVLRDINMTVQPGEIHGLIGPNGSGKSTLLKCVMGAERVSAGEILLDGRRIDKLTPQGRNRRGLSIKFQHAQIVPSLNVRQNIRLALGRQRGIAAWIRNAGRRQEEEERLMDSLGISHRAAEPAVNLSHGEKQWLELAMALASDPGLLLLDEPTAGMSVAERAQTETALRNLTENNRSIILVDHDLDFVRRFSDSITVLNNGELVTTGPTNDVANDPEVRQVYLGGAKK